MHDVIVIGTRCAGAVTSMLLARHGHRVLLVDRASIPCDVPQGHFILKQGPRLIAEWELLEKVVSTNCPPITAHLIDFGLERTRANAEASSFSPEHARLQPGLNHLAEADNV